MRTKKATINVVGNTLSYLMILIPNFIVRKVFLQVLGSELLGLSSLYNNIIGLLSLIELGIGTTIIFSLYKPYAENDREKIKGYLNYYRRFYSIIGILVLILGVLAIPFLKFFIKSEIDINNAALYFLLYLINTCITYLFSYKICLLNVSQEGYKVSLATAISKVAIALLQILFLNIYSSFIIYILIQIVIQLIYYIAINIYISRRNPWLKKQVGKITASEKQDLVKNVKSLFLHKIGSFIVFSTDNLLISRFINLKTVTKYNSYYMVISAAQNVINNGLSGITASIGNLLVEKDKESAFNIHKKLFLLNFWVVSIVIITFFNTLEQFIIIWLGKNQLLDKFTFIIILVNLYFTLMRGSVEKFQEGSGSYYQDRYASLVESIINLVSSLILVNLIGLPGIFLGTLISNILVVFWVKPLVVYKYVFNKDVKYYFNMYFKYILILCVPLILTIITSKAFKYNYSILSFITNVLVNLLIINISYIIIFRKSEEFLYYKKTIISFIFKFKNI